MLCGVPNHGIFDWDDGPGGEFNGRGPFLRGLNEGESEVTPGTAFLTLRSDGIDKFAQPDGRFVGKPGTPTGMTFDGPALKGATNLVLGALDHREVAFHPRAFREIYKFIAGREPSRIEIVPEAEVRLSGLVTGTPGGVVTNRPVVRRDSRNLSRLFRDRRTDRRSDPFVADRRRRPLGSGAGRADLVSGNRADIGGLAHHAYLSLAVSALLRDRASARRAPAWAGRCRRGAVVLMSRPRGYFGLPRDVVLIDGKEPADVKPGVPTDSVTTLRLPAAEAGRPVVALFNQERIVARAWPASENRIAVAELTY